MKLISIVDAAAQKGVVRQTVAGLSRKRWHFFAVDQCGDPAVDIDHPHWKIYIEGGRPSIEAAPAGAHQEHQGTKKAPRKERKDHGGKVSGGKSPDPKGGRKSARRGNTKPEKIITFAPIEDMDAELELYRPVNLKELKLYMEVQLKNIEAQARLGELIDRRIVEMRMQEMGQIIQSSFVDLGRRVSGMICSRLERVGMETTVAGLIEAEVKKGIQDFKILCMKSTSK